MVYVFFYGPIYVISIKYLSKITFSTIAASNYVETPHIIHQFVGIDIVNRMIPTLYAYDQVKMSNGQIIVKNRLKFLVFSFWLQHIFGHNMIILADRALLKVLKTALIIP